MAVCILLIYFCDGRGCSTISHHIHNAILTYLRPHPHTIYSQISIHPQRNHATVLDKSRPRHKLILEKIASLVCLSTKLVFLVSNQFSLFAVKRASFNLETVLNSRFKLCCSPTFMSSPANIHRITVTTAVYHSPSQSHSSPSK